jgi:pimeloyl-ACP methyl ester carboxylesterase
VLAIACACARASATEPPEDLPPAIFTDPAPDALHPAGEQAVQFRSHGAVLNALVYNPPGGGVHPAALLFHGLPGNELNLDLAQTLRRAGWTVVTFHYTGSWGSGGRFTLRRGIDDAVALLAHMREPRIAQAWGIDPTRILLIGHSYGGYIAARLTAGEPGIQGLILLAPWDASFDQRKWSRLATAARHRAAAADFDDVDGRLTGATYATLEAEVMKDGAKLDLAQLAPALTNRPVLLITCTRDDDDDQAADFLAHMQRLNPPGFTSERMDTDHSFNSQRIALEALILHWTDAQHLTPIAEK